MFAILLPRRLMMAPVMSRLDVESVRRRFPALQGEWTFLDNAGGSQTLGAVADRVRDYLLRTDVQLGATYDVSRRAEERVRSGQHALAELVNADPSEVVLGPSTSALLRVLADGLGRALEPGSEIVVTNCDHEANIGPWADLERSGFRIKTWKLNPDTFALETAALERLLTDRTRLVAVTHASNVLGTVNPLREWARLAHERDAMLCVDGVAYAPHRRVDVREWDVDFYTLSLYKVYGPHLALLYGKREHLLRLPRYNHFFIGNALPDKLQPGDVNYELTWGAGAVLDYLSELGAGDLDAAYEQIAAHERVLGDQLLRYLSEKERVQVIGQPVMTESRVPTVSFVVEGCRSSTIPPRTDAANIGIRYGDFYARRLIDDLGLTGRDGVVRVSIVHYNTREEIARLIEALDSWI
jgi:cysteine desulfurase family protein (TIGR01976 family)